MQPAFLRLGSVLAVLMSTRVWAESGPEGAREVKAKPAEPSEQPELKGLLLSQDWLLGKMLTGSSLMATLFPQGVEAQQPWLYRSGKQRVLAIPIHNPEDAPPWEPRVVWLKSKALGPKPVALSARMRVPRLMPGESAWVLLDWPFELEAFHLEVREAESGRGVRVEWEGSK